MGSFFHFGKGPLLGRAASEVDARSGGKGVNSPPQQLTTASLDNFLV